MFRSVLKKFWHSLFCLLLWSTALWKISQKPGSEVNGLNVVENWVSLSSLCFSFSEIRFFFFFYHSICRNFWGSAFLFCHIAARRIMIIFVYDFGEKLWRLLLAGGDWRPCPASLGLRVYVFSISIYSSEVGNFCFGGTTSVTQWTKGVPWLIIMMTNPYSVPNPTLCALRYVLIHLMLTQPMR